MKKALIILTAVLLSLNLVAFAEEGQEATTGTASNSESAAPSLDLSEYATYDPNEDYVYERSDVKEMYDRMHNNESFAIYFGFHRCPWCRDLMPVLNEVSKEIGNEVVYYVNTRENPEWKSNIDIDDYDLLVEMASDYLPYDEKGIKHLNAPTVYFVKGGKIETAVFSPTYDATKRTISKWQKKQLKKKILKAFEKIQ